MSTNDKPTEQPKKRSAYTLEQIARRREQYKAWQSSDRGRSYLAAYYRKNRDKQLARVKVRNAILAGKLRRGLCEVCGNPKVDGHHDDYSKPLDVRWLCKKHHEELHHGGTFKPVSALPTATAPGVKHV